MILKMMETGPLMVNCYIVGDEETGEAAVFDPGGNAEDILRVLKEQGLTLKYIVNTHTHWDHVGGNAGLHEATGAPIVTHKDEAAMLENADAMASMMGGRIPKSPPATVFVEEGDELTVGNIVFKVVDLRGHSPAGIGFLFGEYAIVGDALFAGSIGRTDFPGGDFKVLTDNIRSKLFKLDEETKVLSGHGPVTTVGQEKKYNPFF